MHAHTLIETTLGMALLAGGAAVGFKQTSTGLLLH